MLDIRHQILNKNSPIKRRVWRVLGVALILFISSCSTDSQQKTNPKNPKVKSEVPTFNADSAYYFVEKQVSFGPRYLSSKGWNDCGIWLENKFKTYTSNVIVQAAPVTTYDGKKHTLKNTHHF